MSAHLPVRGSVLEVVFTEEAGGHVATCTGCGWLRWEPEDNRAVLRVHATGHRCRKGDPCLLCGRPVRLGDEGCAHWTPRKAAAS